MKKSNPQTRLDATLTVSSKTGDSGKYARLFRLLADNAREMVSCHSVDLTFLYAPPAATSIIGHRPEDLVGQQLDERTHPDELSSVLSNFAIDNQLT